MLNAFRRFRAMWYPDGYHGWGLQRNYFEGWYFKLVDPSEQIILAIIPGIAMEEDGKRHAFIQVFDGKQCKASYYDFPAKDFRPASDHFAVTLGDNFFSTDLIRLNLPTLKGELKLEQITPWPKMLGAPGIMGWYSFVPFMECYHGVVSLHHHLKGQLSIDGQNTDFDNGIGYTEKDWGRSFPKAWVWMQCNHFDTREKVSLMASVAHIPWVGSHFTGHIVGFQLGKKLYRFATYTGSRLKATLGKNHVELNFKSGKHRLQIKATQAPGAELISPISGEMRGKVNESIRAKLTVQLFEKDQLIFEGKGRNAGLEIAGAVEELFD